MQKENNIPPINNNNNRNTVGSIVILFGIILLFKNLNFGFFFPNWLFSWPLLLIVIGLIIGVNSQFRRKSSVILIIIGVIFLAKKFFNTDFGGLILPIGVIALGTYLLSSRKSFPTPPTPPPSGPGHPNPPYSNEDYDWDKRVQDPHASERQVNPSEIQVNPSETQNQFSQAAASENDAFQEPQELSFKNLQEEQTFEEQLQINSIFASVKKIVLSKKFIGGNILNVFGSVKVDLSQADIQQTVVIDTFQLFGSGKIIVPSNWTVHSNINSIFGDVDDRRDLFLVKQDPHKILYITGSCMFGSITVKNV